MSRLCICVCVWNFLFLYIFLWFFKNIYSISNFCKTIPLSLYDMSFGSNYHMVRRLEVLQCSNRRTTRRLWTVRQRGYWSTCNRHVIRQLGSVCFRKIITFFCMNSNGDTLYMKIIDFDEIYNFVVQTFFIWSHLQTQIINILFRSQFFYQDPVWHLGTTVVSYGGNKIVLQNLKWDIYCWKIEEKNKNYSCMWMCEGLSHLLAALNGAPFYLPGGG
jgi:hypothetical protein